MQNVFLNRTPKYANIFNNEFEDVSKESIKIKVIWKYDYILFYDHFPLETISMGDGCKIDIPNESISGQINIIEKTSNKIIANIPNNFIALLNDSIPVSKHYEMQFGDKISMTNNNITIEVERVCSGKKFKSPLLDDSIKLAYTGMSALFHGLIIAAFAFFMPPLGITDSEEINKDNLYLMQQYLNASAEREQNAKQTEQTATDKPDDKEGGTGTRAKGEEGSMGNPNNRDSNKRYAVAGPKTNMDAHIARSAALREASEFGMIGLINTAGGGDPNAPTAPWGRDDSLGTDPISARGNMWGDEIGDSRGFGGLGLSGLGEGGGSESGTGIGLGNIGTIGRGSGAGNGMGFGNGNGRLTGEHRVKVPIARYGQTTINGRIPPEVVQRIVRQNSGAQKFCYQNGLRNNPNLQGRVTVRFIISRDGSVSSANNGGSDLPDQTVVQCVIRSFYGMSFPAPENGIVSIIYPIIFSAQ